MITMKTLARGFDPCFYIWGALVLTLISTVRVQAQTYHAIYTGSPWYDNAGAVVNAHGGGIIKVGSTYYWFGEYKNNTNDFDAVGCYFSVDLVNWTFVNKVLVRQATGDIGPNRVVERPKVLFCEKTGQFVMFMHVDNLNYNDESIGYATCGSVGGNYVYKGRLQFNGSRIRHWDMGTFKDSDGTGYVLTQGGFAYQLAPDFLSAVKEVGHGMATGREAPAMFKTNGTYFWIFSGKTGWQSNDDIYYTASHIGGPWTDRGNIAPAGKQTWNSQSTFVLPITGTAGTTFMYMGDRWSDPDQPAGTYVWQPLTVNGTSLSLPYHDAWVPDLGTGNWTGIADTGTVVDDSVTGAGLNQFNFSSGWNHSADTGSLNNTKSTTATMGATASVIFSGTQIKVYGGTNTSLGYGSVSLIDAGGVSVISDTKIDFYSPRRNGGQLLWASPDLPNATYTLRVRALGSRSALSSGNTIELDGIVITRRQGQQQASTPIFNPPAGTYSAAQSVSITSATTGALIRFTLDGTEPTSTTGTMYTGPVTIGATSTLNAIASKSGFTDSALTSAVYMIGNGGGATVFQAETAVLAGGAFPETTNGGYHGTGYVNSPISGGSTTFNNVTGNGGGRKKLTIRYALGATAPRNGTLTINGIAQPITFQPTGSWTTWQVITVNVTLTSDSANSIVFASTGSDLANLDEITIL